MPDSAPDAFEPPHPLPPSSHRLREIERRLRAGYYSSAAVSGAIAGRMVTAHADPPTPSAWSPLPGLA